MSKTLFDINCSRIFFHPPLRVMKIKTEISKWDIIKCKIFCTVQEIIKKTDYNPQKGKKYLQTKQPTG